MMLAKWGILEQYPDGGYQLTESGRLIFDDWPPGISFNPNDPDLWRRKKSIER
jgi:hypothetical protein